MNIVHLHLKYRWNHDAQLLFYLLNTNCCTFWKIVFLILSVFYQDLTRLSFEYLAFLSNDCHPTRLAAEILLFLCNLKRYFQNCLQVLGQKLLS